jgi:hypothetical protein
MFYANQQSRCSVVVSIPACWAKWHSAPLESVKPTEKAKSYRWIHVAAGWTFFFPWPGDVASPCSQAAHHIIFFHRCYFTFSRIFGLLIPSPHVLAHPTEAARISRSRHQSPGIHISTTRSQLWLDAWRPFSQPYVWSGSAWWLMWRWSDPPVLLLSFRTCTLDNPSADCS